MWALRAFLSGVIFFSPFSREETAVRTCEYTYFFAISFSEQKTWLKEFLSPKSRSNVEQLKENAPLNIWLHKLGCSLLCVVSFTTQVKLCFIQKIKVCVPQQSNVPLLWKWGKGGKWEAAPTSHLLSVPLLSLSRSLSLYLFNVTSIFYSEGLIYIVWSAEVNTEY